jgi:ABC-type Fe3+-hydroxamate transport system substrate-binding protein
MARLARIFHAEGEGDVKELVRQGYAMLREAEEARKHRAPLRAFCPIWMSPLMTINGQTYISDALDLAGAQNVFADRERRYPLAADLGQRNPLPKEAVAGRDTRYPRVPLEEVESRAPELVILPDEPHPFSDEDAKVFLAQSTPAARSGAVVRTEGKDISWYGSRAVTGIPRLRAVIDRYRVVS